MGLMVFCLLAAAALRFPALNHTPPPIHYDEAANGVILREIAFAGYRPVFIPSYTGKDVLFFYLGGIVTRLGGSSVFTLRYTSALVSLLTIAATYWLGRELIRKRSVALLAAAILTVTFWHILFSRLGFRAISEPLLQALTVAAIWRGLRRDQWRWLVLGGLFLGLTAYTYLSARLFPVPLGLALLVFFLNRQQRGRRWEQIGVIMAVAFLVLIPILLYFRQNPDAFWVRITQVAPAEGRQLTVGQSLLKSLGMFFITGDPYWRYNDPGRPVFNWVWGGFLLAGVWLNVRLLFRTRWDWQRAGWLLLLLTPLMMLLPTALATGEIVPSNIRAIGVLPFVMFWPALGADWLVHDVVQPRRPAWFNSVMAGLVVLTVLGQGGLMADRYFRHWANRVDLFYESDGDIASAAAWLDQYDTENKAIFAAAEHYRHPTAAFLSQKYGEIRWLPGSEALAWPQTGPTLIIYPHNSPAPTWSAPLLTQATVITGTLGPDNLPAFMAYEWASPPTIAVSETVGADFAHVISLVGYTVDNREEGVLGVNLLWRVLNPPAAAIMPFVHLEDQWGYRWSQAESFAYPSEQWQSGDTIWQHVTLAVPAGAPPGPYRLQIGLFNPDTNERLAHLDEVGRFAGTTVTVERVWVAAAKPPATLPQPLHPLNDTILSQLTLIGYEAIPAEVETGAPVNVNLWWQASTYLPPLTIRFELFRPDGFGQILRDTQPVHGSFPFTDWPAPIFLQDHQTFFIPPDLPAGVYRLNLRVLGSADESLYAHELGEITVIATERLFTAPAYTTPLNAHFSAEITLLGYTWSQDETLAHVTLIWQADRVPTADYAVFVHLLDANGVCCAWQSDMAPQQGNYPTSRWLAGEVVVDEYAIPLADLPPGTYSVELGFYLPQTGQRLSVTLRDGTTHDAVYLEPIGR